MEISFLIIAVALTLVGIIGSVLPALPGASLNFLAIAILYFLKDGLVGEWALAIFGVLTVSTMVFDYIFPVLGAKKFGTSKYGIWGLVIGMVFGFFTLSFIGLILGAVFGAIIGELLGGKNHQNAIGSGFATLWGVVMSTIVKFLISLSMTIYFFIKLAEFIF